MLYLMLIVVSAVSASEIDFKSKLAKPAWHDGILEPGLRVVSGRMKRLIALNPKQDINRPSCTLPDGNKGTCGPLRQCIQDDYKNDFIKVLENLCIFNDVLGACCPEDAKHGGIEGLAGDLPAVAPEDETTDAAALKVSEAGNRGCGLTTRRQTDFQGGRVAKPREWPWMVSVSPVAGTIHCGGTLISERHVITAAHCVNQFTPQDIVVRLGEYDFKRTNDTRSYNYQIEDIKIHEEYQHINHRHDIAILKLQRSCRFNTYVWPICLPPPGLQLTDKDATLIGWGLQDYGGKISYVLQEVLVPVWDLNDCINAHVNTVFEENICAGGRVGRKDACQYDSGGPLMFETEGGRWTLVGVVSWGMRCGEPNHPGLYTRVDKYISWIQRNTGL